MHNSRNRNCGRRSFISRLFGRARTEKGQALVELALSFPILVIIFVGAAEFARVVYASIEVSNAAMAGVSYGAQSPTTAGDTTGIQTAVANDAQDLTLGPTTVSKSCICSDGSASTCLSTDCSSSNIETILTVQTQATIDPGVHLPGFATTYTLHGHGHPKGSAVTEKHDIERTSGDCMSGLQAALSRRGFWRTSLIGPTAAPRKLEVLG